MGRNLEAFILQNYQRALDRHEIQAYYQPVVRTSTGQLCSFEALARWLDPELGVIYPDEFIPVLEREGLIHLLDIEILRQVCARIRSAVAAGQPPIPVSVNLSRLDFTLCDIFSLADHVVSDYRIPHAYIYFEITESVMAEQKERMTGIVERFRSAGYQIWMDDFGSAYSSLNVLKEIPFDELKLDMSFLRPFHLRAKRIVTAVVKMAKDIDIHTLAEGVETQEQYEYLRDIGCEKAQGFYFGRPLPYEEAVAALKERGIRLEAPQDRHYYDVIGKIDFLSAVPFMTREEYDAIGTGRELNSIPLALAEFSADEFTVLFYNTAFEETARSAGMFTRVFTQQMLARPQPYHMLSRNIVNLMDSVGENGEGRMFFTLNEQYYEIKARRMARTEGKYCVLICITNLTKDTQAEKTDRLDDSVRQIYALYERITLLNYPEDSIRPLYTDIREDLLSNRRGIKRLVEEYAGRYIYPEDRERFVRVFDPPTATQRLEQSGGVSFFELFRTNVRHGRYAWKEYTLLKLDAENYFLLVRNVHEIARDFLSGSAPRPGKGGPYAPEQLWSNLVRSELFRVFWKDKDRRFLGASKGFLDFYGFASDREIVGKNDEEMGWHVHPDLYMNDEYRVIHEGVTFRNVAGTCMSHGENRAILASKTPLYDENGEITGLLGYFIDEQLLNVDDRGRKESSRRDLLTGLLNSRGISEEVESFRDEYHLRGTDFARIHIGINDFNLINEQYGFDFGDKVLAAFGQELRRAFGQTAAIGRYAGRKFALLQQVADREEGHRLIEQARSVGEAVREVDGRPITLYLSVGCAFYSESDSTEDQTRSAEVRLHAYYDRNSSAESRVDHALELFHMFDDLPVPYAVFHVTREEREGSCGAVFFYVNHSYEEYSGLSAKKLLGRSVREVFPFLGEDWYRDARSAALDGLSAESEYDDPRNNKHYRTTARQVIYPGYCAITFVQTPVQKARRQILIADDSDINREILGEYLSGDYEVYYARDGVEALEMLRGHKGEFDLLVLDLYMPNMSGWEVLSVMQADAELASVPVIVLTVDHEAELRALKQGALDFIPKPYPDIEIVKARIAKCISLAQKR